jgi:hypothetical protein
MIQLELPLFQETTETRHEREIVHLHSKLDQLRKGQHARISTLQKEIKELKSELEFLKAKICKEGMFL